MSQIRPRVASPRSSPGNHPDHGLSRAAAVLATAFGGSLGVLLGPRPTFVTAGLLGLVTAGVAAVALRRQLGGMDQTGPMTRAESSR